MGKEPKQQKRAVSWHDGIRVPSDVMPGHPDGSYVEVPRRFKRKYAKRLREITRRALLPERDKDGNPTADHLPPEEADKLTIELFLDIGIRWNWIGVDGAPLPQPEDDPSVYEEISDDEIIFIIEHIEDGTTIPPPKGTAS